MAYSTGCSGTPRVNIFSNPDMKYAGKVQGTDEANNARVLNEAMVRRLLFLTVHASRPSHFVTVRGRGGSSETCHTIAVLRKFPPRCGGGRTRETSPRFHDGYFILLLVLALRVGCAATVSSLFCARVLTCVWMCVGPLCVVDVHTSRRQASYVKVSPVFASVTSFFASVGRLW